MPSDGYIKLYRKMVKWGWYTDTNTKCVFLHLLLMAQYEARVFNGLPLEVGQVVTSIRQISKEINVSVQSVRTSLNHLKSTQEVTQSTYGKFSVFTINRYSEYQCDGKQLTQCQHSANTDPYNKKLRKKEYTGAFDTFWSQYPNKTAKVKAAAAFEKIRPDDALLETILKALAVQKRTEQWTRDGGKYIPHPATWLNGHRWEDETEKETQDDIRYY
ncbi:MAG: hypothetical protein RSD27_09650 [Ruthenibacterium sp.]